MGATASTESARWQPRGQQHRSLETQDAFLQAAQDLMAEKGIHATSVNEVAERAGRSIGSLYHHFTDKQTLVYAVVDRITVDIEAGIDAGLDPDRWTDKGILDIVRGYLTDAIALDHLRPGYKRVVNEAVLIDPVAKQTHVALRQRVNDGLTDLFLQRAETIGHSNADTAVRFAVDQLSAMLRDRLDPETNPSQLSGHDDETFIEESVTSVDRHLRITVS